MNLPTNDEYQFLVAIRDGKPYPFKGAAAAAVIGFLEGFHWINFKGSLTDLGRMKIEEYENVCKLG